MKEYNGFKYPEAEKLYEENIVRPGIVLPTVHIFSDTWPPINSGITIDELEKLETNEDKNNLLDERCRSVIDEFVAIGGMNNNALQN